ncbi:alpha/beta fold hydrolase [Micromonospora sp. NPDC052213]|uniref:alpha/beta fold hydrolase n=1 Tax=Micromonospora sp. NPDC052213 TaxID=3155812 RepID=UPI003432B457
MAHDAMSWAMCRRIRPRDRRCPCGLVAADIPGQPGLSSGEVGVTGGGLTWYGSWLGEVVQEATAGPVVVFGHSFGGAVALAANHSRIRGTVAVAPGGLCRLRVTPRVLLAFLSWLVRPRAASSLQRHNSGAMSTLTSSPLPATWSPTSTPTSSPLWLAG